MNSTIGRGTVNARAAPGGRIAVALRWWVAVQVVWLSSLGLLASTVHRTIPEAWLYPVLADVVIGCTAIPLAIALRRPTPRVWLVAVVWLAAGAFIRVNEVAICLKVAAPDGFFGGSRPLAVSVVVFAALANLATVVALCRQPLRGSMVGAVLAGAQPSRRQLWISRLIAVWAATQVGRFIALGVIGDVLHRGDNPAWLAPALGDLIVATPALFVAFVLWTRRSPWVWVTTFVFYAISIVDHLDTITGDVRTPAPHTFASMSTGSFPTWGTPLLQAVVDAVCLWALARTAMRRTYLQPTGRWMPNNSPKRSLPYVASKTTAR